MARQKISELQKSPSRKRSNAMPSPKFAKWSILHGIDSQNIPRISIPSHRTQHSKPKLPVILEEVEEEREQIHRDRDIDFHDEDENTIDEYDWQEETTLVAMLQDEFHESSDDDRFTALVEELRAPMSEQGRVLRQHFVRTLVPAVVRVKNVHASLEANVDPKFGQGIVSFNDACKKMEELAIKEEDDLKSAYSTTQRHMKVLLAQLQEAYEERGQLWVDLQMKVDQIADAAIADLMTLPPELERLQSALEKKSKALLKDGANAAKEKEKIARALMG